jgi:hypothetical protein
VGKLSQNWIEPLKFNPTLTLLHSGNKTIEYFTKRDLIGENVEPLNWVWQLPPIQKIFRNQQANGSWSHIGKETVAYPLNHYSLSESWKTYRMLVEQYQINKSHEGAKKAAEFLFSYQTAEGDIRGMLANQYATYYTGAILSILIKAGYANDLRVEKGLKWLLSMRQDDGGWTIPILTHDFELKKYYYLTNHFAEPVEPDRSKPFSHNWTDMVLRAFAAHPIYRQSKEASKAANLLKSAFFLPDFYSSYKDADYWVRFRFWWPNLVTALDILSAMGYSKDDSDVKRALCWFIENQCSDGLWKLTYAKKGKQDDEEEKLREERLWLTLKVARIFKRFYQ